MVASRHCDAFYIPSLIVDLVVDDEDAGHPEASRWSTTSPARTGVGRLARVPIGMSIVKVAPPPGVSATEQ